MPADVAAEVISNTTLSVDYNVLTLAAASIAREAAPGQFVMVKSDTGCDPLLRRPFSVFEIVGDAREPIGISLLNKRIGPSTAKLYAARPGQRISCLGPLGRPFTPVDPPTDAWMVAGGVGLAPFASLAVTLRERRASSMLFYGARRAEELFYLDYFRELGVDVVLTTEDGSAGERGRIVAPLERRLTSRGPTHPPMVYVCGPEGLLAACARITGRFGAPCQVSVERVMGCGLGGCYSCVIPVRDGIGAFQYVRSCLAGPVLAADQIVWER